MCVSVYRCCSEDVSAFLTSSHALTNREQLWVELRLFCNCRTPTGPGRVVMFWVMVAAAAAVVVVVVVQGEPCWVDETD